MKLWHISQSKNNSYDTYDSAVVAAETEQEARTTSPGEGVSDLVWNTAKDSWVQTNGVTRWGLYGNGSWTAPRYVTVEFIGEAKEGTKPGAICSSFNAG